MSVVPEPLRLIGLKGVQALTDRPRGTVGAWKARGLLPPADAVRTDIDGEDMWFEQTIRDWWPEFESRTRPRTQPDT